jgi:hypothetical protein
MEINVPILETTPCFFSFFVKETTEERKVLFLPSIFS